MRVWDAESGRPVGQPLAGHTDAVVSVVFSPDGKQIATASNDDSVRVWDAATGRPVGDPLTGHTDTVTSVAVSPDGRTIVSGSYDNTLHLWPAYPADASDATSALCAKLITNMSRQQWNDWVSPSIDYIEACPGLPTPADG